MLDEFAVEKLKQIKAGFDALQAENEELRAELALLRADKADIAAVMAQNAEVDSLRARVAELESARRWISTGEMCDNLPDADGDYIVFYGGKVFVADFSGGWFWDKSMCWCIEPDYWQPLPAAPEDDNES